MSISLDFSIAKMVAVGHIVSVPDVVSVAEMGPVDEVVSVGKVIAAHHLAPFRLRSCDQITPVDAPVPATAAQAITLSTHNP